MEPSDASDKEFKPSSAPQGRLLPPPPSRGASMAKLVVLGSLGFMVLMACQFGITMWAIHVSMGSATNTSPISIGRDGMLIASLAANAAGDSEHAAGTFKPVATTPMAEELDIGEWGTYNDAQRIWAFESLNELTEVGEDGAVTRHIVAKVEWVPGDKFMVVTSTINEQFLLNHDGTIEGMSAENEQWEQVCLTDPSAPGCPDDTFYNDMPDAVTVDNEPIWDGSVDAVNLFQRDLFCNPEIAGVCEAIISLVLKNSTAISLLNVTWEEEATPTEHGRQLFGIAGRYGYVRPLPIQKPNAPSNKCKRCPYCRGCAVRKAQPARKTPSRAVGGFQTKNKPNTCTAANQWSGANGVQHSTCGCSTYGANCNSGDGYVKPAPPPPPTPPTPRSSNTRRVIDDNNLIKGLSFTTRGPHGARTGCDTDIAAQTNSPELLEKCRCKARRGTKFSKSLTFCEKGDLPDFMQRCIKATDNCKVDPTSPTYYACQCVDGQSMCPDKSLFNFRNRNNLCSANPGGPNPPSCCP